MRLFCASVLSCLYLTSSPNSGELFDLFQRLHVVQLSSKTSVFKDFRFETRYRMTEPVKSNHLSTRFAKQISFVVMFHVGRKKERQPG